MCVKRPGIFLMKSKKYFIAILHKFIYKGFDDEIHDFQGYKLTLKHQIFNKNLNSISVTTIKFALHPYLYKKYKFVA